MPLAKSPISSETLPRPPNSRRPTARTRIQCQTLNEPISYLRTDEERPRLPVHEKLGAMRRKNKDCERAGSNPAPAAATCTIRASPLRSVRLAVRVPDRGHPALAGPHLPVKSHHPRAWAPRTPVEAAHPAIPIL